MFSPNENLILKILGKRKITVSKLTEEFYNSRQIEKPFEANNMIAGSIRRINHKCKYNNLNWFINGEGMGRNGKTIWKEKVNVDSQEA